MPLGRLFKVWLFPPAGRGKELGWYEVEDADTRQGVSWSPSLDLALERARDRGYSVNPEDCLLRFYRRAG